MKDHNNKDLSVGDVCTYRPDLDGTEQMFGSVPSEYEGDLCTVKTLRPCRVTFEGSAKEYKVSTFALVLMKKSNQPAPTDEPKQQQ